MEKQSREVAAKFARDAIRLIERGKAPDVCARKLQAAACVLIAQPFDAATELLAQRTMLGVAVRDLQLCRDELHKVQNELAELRAHYVDDAIREHGVTVDPVVLEELRDSVEAK